MAHKQMQVRPTRVCLHLHGLAQRVLPICQATEENAMSIIAASADRVPRHTSTGANARIARATSERLARIGDDRAAIAARLRELDREWDVERAIQANASTLALGGLVLGLTVDRRFHAVPAVVTAFLLQHALQGWCPPLPVLRRMGFRTPREIEDERHALLQRSESIARPTAGRAASSERPAARSARATTARGRAPARRGRPRATAAARRR